MSRLTSIQPAPTSRPALDHAHAARMIASNPNGDARNLSGLHLDGDSTCYGGEEDARNHDRCDESGHSEYSKEVIEKDNEDAAASGDKKVETVQMGMPTERDVESGDLEKAKTPRSARSAQPTNDPNLVCLIIARLYFTLNTTAGR